MKKLLIALSVCFMAMTCLVGCSSNDNGGSANYTGDLEDLMTKVYEGIKQEDTPMMLMNMPLDSENYSMFIGEATFKYEEALASESAVGSIAHSVVLIRMAEGADMAAAAAELKTTVNPRKWICVGVEEVKVETKGNMILVVLNDNIGDTLVENFKKAF